MDSDRQKEDMERERERDRDRDTDRQTERQTETDRDRLTEKGRKRQRERFLLITESYVNLNCICRPIHTFRVHAYENDYLGLLFLLHFVTFISQLDPSVWKHIHVLGN